MMAQIGLILKILVVIILFVPSQGRKQRITEKTFDLQATTTKKSIYSPNYPNKYYRYLKYTWNIKAAAGMMIELDLEDMFIEKDTNCKYDYLEIYDGTKKIARLCGEEYSSQIFTTTQSSSVIVFYSDETVTDYGFSIVYKAIEIIKTTTTPPPPPPTTTTAKTTTVLTTTVDHKPTTVMNSETTTADLKTSTKKYDASTAEQVTSTPITTTTKNTITSEKTTSKTITSSTTTERTTIQTTTTTEKTTTSTTTEKPVKRVVTSSGKSVAIPTCSNTYPIQHLLVASETRQVFMSQGYPTNYPSNLKEEWLIVKPNATVPLALIILDADLEEMNGCEYDFMTIYDDACPTDSVGSFCGTKKPSFTLTGGQFALARISTDHSDHHRGIKIQYYLGKAPADANVEESNTLRDVVIGVTVAIVSFTILFGAVRCFIVFKRKRAKAQKHQRGRRASGSRGRRESRSDEINSVSRRTEMRIRNNSRRGSAQAVPPFTELMVEPPSYSALFTETALHHMPQPSSNFSLEPGKVPLYDEPSCLPPPYSIKVLQPAPVEMPPSVAYRTRSRTRNSRNNRSQGHSSSEQNPPTYNASVINVEPPANVRDIISPPPAYDTIQQNRNLRVHRTPHV